MTIMRRLQDRLLENEPILLSDKGANAFTALGPNLELKNCTLTLKISAKAFALSGPKLYNCKIQVVRPLHTFRWCNAYLENCTFTGKLIGNDFGHWPPYFHPDGGLVRGDFSNAILDGVRFINVETSSIIFPKWPCFTILRPSTRVPEFNSINWPGRMATFSRTFKDEPREVNAITVFATELASQFGTSEDEIFRIVKELDDIIY